MSSNDSPKHSMGAFSAFGMDRSDALNDPPPSDPTFRSVRIGTMSKPVFGAMGPLPKLGKAPMLGSSFGTKPALSSSVPTNTDEASPKFIWVVTVAPSVPEFYPLERTVLKLQDVSLSDICGRISEFMRQKSIKCADDPTSEACIGCLTPGLLKFVVQLWKGDEQDGVQEAQTIIVEVQRRRGCAIEMKGIRNCLYHSIRNGGDGSAAKRPSRAPRALPSGFASKIASTPPAASSSSLESHAEDPLSRSLERCASMLSSDKLDLQRLGLESLCKMTNPSMVSQADAVRVAEAVLLGDGDNLEIRDSIESVLAASLGEDDSGLNDTTSDACHLLALEALGNSLQMHLGRKSTEALDLSNDFWCTALDSFTRNLNLAASRPMEAALSAKAIRLLQTVEPSVLTMAAPGDDLQSLLLTAYQYGKSSHSALEKESGELMGQVSITC